MDNRALILTLSEWLGVVAVLMLAGLSPRLSVPPVGFKYPRREGIVALSLFGLILAFRSLLAAGTMNSPIAVNLRSGGLDARLYIAVLGLVPFILALLIRRQPPRSAGWYAKALGGSLRVGLVLAALSIILRGKALSILNGVTPEETRSLLLWLGICLAEETIFRGYIQQRLSFWWGSRWGLPVVALLSLVWQLPLMLVSQQDIALNLALNAVHFLLLGWIAQKSKHVIAPVLYRAVSEWLSMLH